MPSTRVLLPGGPALPAGPDPEFDRFATMARRLIDVPLAAVSLARSDGQVYPGLSGAWEPYMSTRHTQVTDCFTDQVIQTGAAVVVEDVTQYEWPDPFRWDQVDSVTSAGGALGAYAGYPLTNHKEQVIGTLCVMDDVPRRFSERELNDLAALAEICSQALTHRTAVQGMHRAQQRAKHISRLNRMLLKFNEALGEAHTAEEVAHILQILTKENLDAPFFALVLENDGRFEAVEASVLPRDVPLAYSDLSAKDRHPGVLAAKHREPQFFADLEAFAAQFPDLANRSSSMVSAQSYLPIVRRGRGIGWLWLGWDAPRENVVDSREVKSALARYASQALERAELLRERLEVALTLQEALLAKLAPVEGLELAARYLAASTYDKVGGDWYDSITAHGRTTLIIGDVVGHNIAAAAQMGHLRSILRGFTIDRPEEPAALLGRLDRANLALGNSAMATALVAQIAVPLLPRSSARITWSSAGHPQPLLIRASGEVQQLNGATDLLLGLLPTASRQNHAHLLEAGSTLLLFTDGLVERRGNSIEQTTAELCRAAADAAGLPLEQMLDSILHAMGDSQERDDIAVLAARITDPN